MSMMLSTQ